MSKIRSLIFSWSPPTAWSERLWRSWWLPNQPTHLPQIDSKHRVQIIAGL